MKLPYLFRRIVSFSYGAPAVTSRSGNQEGHRVFHWIGFRPLLRKSLPQ